MGYGTITLDYNPEASFYICSTKRWENTLNTLSGAGAPLKLFSNFSDLSNQGLCRLFRCSITEGIHVFSILQKEKNKQTNMRELNSLYTNVLYVNSTLFSVHKCESLYICEETKEFVSLDMGAWKSFCGGPCWQNWGKKKSVKQDETPK